MGPWDMNLTKNRNAQAAAKMAAKTRSSAKVPFGRLCRIFSSSSGVSWLISTYLGDVVNFQEFQSNRERVMVRFAEKGQTDRRGVDCVDAEAVLQQIHWMVLIITNNRGVVPPDPSVLLLSLHWLLLLLWAQLFQKNEGWAR